MRHKNTFLKFTPISQKLIIHIALTSFLFSKVYLGTKRVTAHFLKIFNYN